MLHHNYKKGRLKATNNKIGNRSIHSDEGNLTTLKKRRSLEDTPLRKIGRRKGKTGKKAPMEF